MDIGLILALWLHTLAFVIAWGYYGVLGRIILPALARSLDDASQVSTLAAVERRALPLVGVSLLMFMVTGTYLLVSDPEYAGLGDVLASTWTTMMLVKHLLVVALVAMGVVIDGSIRRAATATDSTVRDQTLRHVSLGAEAATGLGALIALVTAIGQAS